MQPGGCPSRCCRASSTVVVQQQPVAEQPCRSSRAWWWNDKTASLLKFTRSKRQNETTPTPVCLVWMTHPTPAHRPQPGHHMQPLAKHMSVHKNTSRSPKGTRIAPREQPTTTVVAKAQRAEQQRCSSHMDSGLLLALLHTQQLHHANTGWLTHSARATTKTIASRAPRLRPRGAAPARSTIEAPAPASPAPRTEAAPYAATPACGGPQHTCGHESTASHHGWQRCRESLRGQHLRQHSILDMGTSRERTPCIDTHAHIKASLHTKASQERPRAVGAQLERLLVIFERVAASARKAHTQHTHKHTHTSTRIGTHTGRKAQ